MKFICVSHGSVLETAQEVFVYGFPEIISCTERWEASIKRQQTCPISAYSEISLIAFPHFIKIQLHHKIIQPTELEIYSFTMFMVVVWKYELGQRLKLSV